MLSPNGLQGLTLLHAAAYYGQLEVVRWLCEEAGADVEARGEKQLTPLHLAAISGHLPVVAYLVKEHRAPVGLAEEPERARRRLRIRDRRAYSQRLCRK